MASVQAFGQTATDVASGGGAWNNLGNIGGYDGSYTDQTWGAGSYGNYLDITNYDFSSIPSGSIIDGIVTNFIYLIDDAAWAIANSKWQLIKGGTAQGDDQSDINQLNAIFPSSRTINNPTYLWGLSWALSDIKGASDFGMRLGFSSIDSLAGGAKVDGGAITVYYHTAATQQPRSFNYQPFLAQ